MAEAPESGSHSARSPPRSGKLGMAKWGAACTTCSNAKAKCIRSNENPGSKCDRCERLLKDCHEQVHKPRKKRQLKTSRTSQIEQRLNGLVNYLKAQGDLTDVELAADTTCIPAESEPRYAQQQSPSENRSASFRSTLNPWAIPEKYNSYAPPSCICRPESGDAPPPPDTDDALLDVYRNEMQELHPFVIVPAHVKADGLRRERPFLMSAIRMVASYRSLRSMRAQMYHLMKHISDYMLVRSEKSLDLLLGIVVVLGWYQFHCFMHGQFNNLISLAATLAGELGLTRHPSVHERTNLMMPKPKEAKPRSNEERRAFAGVWFVSSVMSTTFWKTDSMRYTYYLQQCLSELAAQKEVKSDINLVHLVRIQHLSERICQHNLRDKGTEEVSTLPSAPPAAYIASFQDELHRIRQDLPPDLKEDGVFQTYLHSANLRLCEPPAVDAALLQSISGSLTSISISGISPLDRLYQSSAALNAWFENWLSVPVSSYYCQTSHLSAQIVFALTMLGRWAKLATPRTMFEGEGTIPPGPSANNPSQQLYEEVQKQADRASLKAREAAAATGKGPGEKSSCFIHGDSVGEVKLAPDPAVPAAVASLRSQIDTQPGLQINIPYILAAVGSRFEEASEALHAASTEPDQAVHNIFSMSSMKLKITRVKLQQWADLIATKTAAMSLDESPATSLGVASVSAAATQSAGGGSSSSAMNGSDATTLDSYMDDQMAMQNFYGATPWTTDLLQGIDPALWLDENLDWAQSVVNSMQTGFL